MTTSDLSGSCKPFGVAKAVAEAVYEEFYNQVRDFSRLMLHMASSIKLK